SEYQRLTHVLLHRPGSELEASANPDAVNMLEPLDLARAQAQHDALADVYRTHGITVTYADPASTPTPNQMFMADVFVMTPEGAIVARPASQVRAGEERVAARRLSDIGVPILRSINNRGTFEGADLMWLDPQTAIVGRGLRTNDDGAAQIEQLLTSMGIRMIKVDLPFGSMHLMGMLRIVDRNLAIVWPSRFVHRGVDALRERGFHVAMLPENEEVRRGAAFNFVTIAPRTIVMAAGNPRTQAWFEQHGITCVTTPVDELAKAAGAIGCLTGIVARDM
ncbi:MAG: dimethylarginine dimethylaminohydrolase family protein, partial [Roseiflexaceae bacterium]